MRLAKIVWAFLIIILAAIVGSCVWFLTVSYQQIIQLAVEQLQRPDIQNILEQRFFTPQKFEASQLMAKVSIVLVGLLMIYVIVIRKTIWQKLNLLFEALKKGIVSVINNIKNSSRPIKYLLGLLLLLVAVRSVYYALHFYPQYDECWNYNYFLSNSFLTTFVAYNNYPLHNVIMFLFLNILPDSTFVMRLPNIILGVLNTILVFALIKKIFQNEKIALAGAAIFSVLPTAVFYMLFARGIMLALFFALLILYIISSKPIEKLSKTEIVLLILIGSLGCFSMISFPVFLLVLFILLIIKNLMAGEEKTIYKLLVLLLGTAFVTLLFYSPMIMGGGFQLGFSSAHGASILDWKLWKHKVEEISRNQIGFYTASYFFILINLFLLYLSRRKKIAAFNLALLLIPFIFPLLTKIYFPARALSFQVFAYVFTFCIVLEIILARTNKYVLAACSLLVIVAFSYISGTHTFLTWSAKPDKAAQEIARIFQEKNITSYYDNSSSFHYFVPGILYHHKIKNTVIEFYTADKSSTRFSVLDDFSGNCFVEKRKTFVPSINKEIVYEYSDVDINQLDTSEDFIVYLLTPNP